MSSKLAPGDLMNLEEYARQRQPFRARVMEHKAHRRLHLGDHLTLCFEDRLTMQYQVQEMLRAERIFETADILAEVEAYNPLIPDGSNWKATMLIEYPDSAERREALTRLGGIESRVWVCVAGRSRVFAIADEDLARTTDEKTSAVHFLRFELSAEMISDLKSGGALSAGVDHTQYSAVADPVPEMLRESLIADLN
jgi:uncharacterized protein YggL (DUF469 family)